MEEKILVVERMVSMGYKLMDRTVEDMASSFSLETLLKFEENFKKWLDI